MKYFSFTKIPLLFFLRPRLVELTEQECVIKIPLSRRSKNHLGSMYFAALAAGADLSGAYLAMKLIGKSEKKISLSFKDFSADFLKRAEGDTYFTCKQGREIAEFVERVANGKDRETMKIEVIATCPDKLGNEPVATFELGLSLKCY